MSYRMHLAIIDADTVDDIRHLPPEHYTPLTDDEDEIAEITAFYNFVPRYFGKKDEFCIGALPIEKDIGEPFYHNVETQKIFEHYNPRIISKEDYIHIVDLMRQFICRYYENRLKCDAAVWREELREKSRIWSAPFGITPYNLREETKDISQTNDAEYMIFDMVRMFKMVNWEKDLILFYGW